MTWLLTVNLGKTHAFLISILLSQTRGLLVAEVNSAVQYACHRKETFWRATQKVLKEERTEESPLNEIDLGTYSKFVTGQFPKSARGDGKSGAATWQAMRSKPNEGKAQACSMGELADSAHP